MGDENDGDVDVTAVDVTESSNEEMWMDQRPGEAGLVLAWPLC